MAASPPPPPDGLTPAQAELWQALTARRAKEYGRHVGVYDAVRLAELRAVVEIAGRVEAMREQIARDGLMVGGSTGQQRAHPLLALEAGLRAEFAAALTAWQLT